MEYKVLYLSGYSPEEKQRMLNASASDGWKLITVADGHAYLERLAQKKETSNFWDSIH